MNSKSRTDLLLDQSLIARSNWGIARVCTQILKAPPTTPTAVFAQIMTTLHTWWQNNPAGAPRLTTGTPPTDLCELVFSAYCYAGFRMRTPQSELKLIEDVPWGQKPLFAPRPLPRPEDLFYSICVAPDPLVLVRRWAHQKRWHERVTRSRYWVVVPTETTAYDPLVSLFRGKLEESYLAANHMDAFFTQGRTWLRGSLLPLGARNEYTRDKPLEAQTTPMAKLYDAFLSAEVKENMAKMIDIHPVQKWTELSPDFQEMWLLLYYCFAFDQYTVGETRFANMYVILWHQWDQPHSDALLDIKERLHRPALPLLCALGGGAWGVLSQLSEWRVCENMTHALVVWLQQVMAHHQGQAENGLGVWTCGMRVPLPAEAGAGVGAGAGAEVEMEVE